MNTIDMIFKDIHGEINLKELTRLVDTNIMELEEVQECANRLDSDPDAFLVNSTSIINPFVYYKDLFFYAFRGFGVKSITLEDDEFSEVRRFKAQRDMFQRKLDTEDYLGAIMFSDKRVRLQLFQNLFPNIPDSDKFDIFMKVYSTCEYGFGSLSRSFMNQVFKHRHNSKSWKPFSELFPELGEEVTVYRGATTQSSPITQAYSWTLNKETAEFFSTRFNQDGEVLEGRVHVDDIMTYYNGRGEHEVLIGPGKVHIQN